MARGNLGAELRSLLERSKSSGRPARKEGVRFQPKQGLTREVTLEIAPIRLGPASNYHFLILFEELAPAPPATEKPPPITPREKREKQKAEVTELKQELAATKAHLQATIEESEAANEELKSANEEIMSSNEELQSTNEELETAKEELQSSNEELTTVNEEVQVRNAELSLLNSDLSNFLGSVNVPVIMLGTDLRIRRFTPMTQRVFNLIPTDIGRPFGDIKPKVNVPHLDRLIAQVIDTIAIHEQEVIDDKGRYYRMSIRPYRTPENKIDGAVLVFSDIDSVKRAGLQLEEAKTYSEAIVEAILHPLLVLDADFIIQRANSAYYRLFETDAGRTENRSLFAIDKSQWDTPEVHHLLQMAFKHRQKIQPVEINERFSRIGERSLLLNARFMARKSGEPPLILLAMADVTARKLAEVEKVNLARLLTKERALFEGVLHQMWAGVAIFEAPGGRLLLANNSLQSMLKRKLPASAPISFFHKIPAIHATYRGPVWPMERSLRKGEIVSYEEIILEHGRAERTVLQVSSSPVYDEQKRMIAVVALFQDITERKRIKEQLVDISSREQQRIAHDLHDGLGQELAAIGYRIKALKAHLGRAQAAEADEAGKIGFLMETALARTRDLIRFLQPVAMDARGLMHGLKDLAETSSRLYHVACAFTCPRPVAISHPDVATHVFRIAQEAVHNAVKHGKPSRIVIGLRQRRNLAELTIANNGSDFNPLRGAHQRGFGLHIMSYRANVLHGELTIKRHHPKGTLVKCIFTI